MLSVFPQGHFQLAPVLVTILLVPIRCQTLISSASSSWDFEENMRSQSWCGFSGMLSCLWVLPKKSKLGAVVLTGTPNGNSVLVLSQVLPAEIPAEPLLIPGLQNEHPQAAAPAPTLPGSAARLHFRPPLTAFLRSALPIATAPHTAPVSVGSLGCCQSSDQVFPPCPSSFWDEHLELSADAWSQALPAPRVLGYFLHLRAWEHG